MADQNVVPIDKAPRGRPPSAATTIGRPGLKQFAGHLYEEFLPALQGQRGIRVYSEMAQNDSVIAGFLFAINALLTQVEWHAEPHDANNADDRKASEFIGSCLRDMSDTWSDFISEALSFLVFGWSMHEVTWKKRAGRNADPLLSSKFDDGLWGWRSFDIRGQETLDDWKFDDKDRLLGMNQRPGPSYQEFYIPLTKGLLFRLNPKKQSPEGVSLLRGVYRCYSDDTEILTKDGWRAIGDVTLADEVATLNPATDELEYHRPRKVYRYPYQGKMFRQSGRFVDLLVTPNHRMYVRRDSAPHFEFIEAQNLKKSVYFKLDCLWRGEEIAEFLLPAWVLEQRVANGFGSYSSVQRVHHAEKCIPMDDWLRFFGIWLAEGCTYRAKSGQRSVMITQNEGPKLDLIKTWVEACGFQYRIKRDRGQKRAIEICSAQLYDYLAQFGKAADKFIPAEIKALSPRQLTILFEAMHLGDGGIGGGAGKYAGTKQYFTISERLADDVSEILFKMGHAARIGVAGAADRWGKNTVWRVTAGKARRDGNRVNLFKDQREWVDYDGDVHCVEVRNHIVYVRRNGKACWCGNSWFFKKRLQELEAIGVERNLAGLPVLRIPEKFWTDPEWVSERATWEQVVRNLKRDEQEGVILPSARDEQGNLLYELTLLSTGARRQSDTNALVQRYNAEIAMAALSDFMLLGHSRVGTFALGVTKTELFATAFSYVLDVIANEINEREISRLLMMNGMPGEAKLVHGKPGNVDLERFSGMIKNLVEAGIPVHAADGSVQRFILEQLGLPSGHVGADNLGVAPPMPRIGEADGGGAVQSPAGSETT